MRASYALFASAALALCYGCNSASAQEVKSKAMQRVLPQAKPWTPPTTGVPEEWAKTASIVLAHGLGDPRGGTYRAAKIQIGSVWGGEDKPSDAHGWVLPDGGFVAWNGLVYKPVSVGDPADLEADVQKALDRSGGIPQLFVGRSSAVDTPVTPIGVCLLLVDGRNDLANEVAAGIKAQRDVSSLDSTVFQFLSSWFERAVTAHMRGDDLLAANDAAAILAARPALEKAIDDQPAPNLPGGAEARRSRFAFLDPTATLQADSERRLSEGALPQPSNPTAALIQKLDQVSARQMGQPGSVSLAMDPIVSDLIKQGDVAVELLLDCMERDTRLTRSVSFGRDFFPQRNLITVKSAAFAAFRGIVDLEDFSSGNGQEPSVQELRTWWAANKGKAPYERWVGVLADDKAGYERWIEAGTRLVEDVSVKHGGRGIYLSPMDGPGTAMKGEAARKLANPSVSQLLTRRANELADSRVLGSTDEYRRLAASPEMARILLKWDSTASVSTAREVAAKCLVVLNGPVLHEYGPTMMARSMGYLESALLKAGDHSTLDDYAAWLSKVPPSEMFGFVVDSMAPFWKHPDDPAIQTASKFVFEAPDSSWNVRTLSGKNQSALQDLANSALLQNATFRDALIRVLDQSDVVGEVWRTPNGGASYRLTNGGSGGGQRRTMKSPDPYVSDEKHYSYRANDMIAWELTGFKQIPDFEPFWPTEVKDRVIQQIKQVLRTQAGEMAKDARKPFITFQE